MGFFCCLQKNIFPPYPSVKRLRSRGQSDDLCCFALGLYQLSSSHLNLVREVLVILITQQDIMLVLCIDELCMITPHISARHLPLTGWERHPTDFQSPPHYEVYRIQQLGAYQNISSKVRDKLLHFALPTMKKKVQPWWAGLPNFGDGIYHVWACYSGRPARLPVLMGPGGRKGSVAVQATIRASLPLGFLAYHT